jgi:pSer/pThr/pTyr-binding forkhead associated (FHA) protein
LYSAVDPDQELVIGRSPNCDIRIDDELLSKTQATVSFDPERQTWAISDGHAGKGSTNGTWLYLNEEKKIHSGMLLKSNQTFF